MKHIAIFSVSLGLLGVVVAGTGTALAATEEDIAEALLQETLASLEVSVEDPALLDDLAAGLEQAITEEIVDPVLVEEVNDALDDGQNLDLGEVLDENLGKQDEAWDAESDALEVAFQEIRAQFQECRAASLAEGARFGASECAQGLGFRFQVAAATVRLNAVMEREATLAGLEGDELAAAEEELATLRTELEAQLARAEQKLERTRARGESAGAVAADLQQLEEVSAQGRSVLSAESSRGSSSNRGNSGQSGTTNNPDSGASTTDSETETGGQGNSGQSSDSGNQGSSADRGNSGSQSDRGNQGERGNQGRSENQGKGQQGSDQ